MEREYLKTIIAMLATALAVITLLVIYVLSAY